MNYPNNSFINSYGGVYLSDLYLFKFTVKMIYPGNKFTYQENYFNKLLKVPGSYVTQVSNKYPTNISKLALLDRLIRPINQSQKSNIFVSRVFVVSPLLFESLNLQTSKMT